MIPAAIDLSNSSVVGPTLEEPGPAPPPPPEVLPEEDIHFSGPDRQHLTPDKEPVSTRVGRVVKPPQRLRYYVSD